MRAIPSRPASPETTTLKVIKNHLAPALVKGPSSVRDVQSRTEGYSPGRQGIGYLGSSREQLCARGAGFLPFSRRGRGRERCGGGVRGHTRHCSRWGCHTRDRGLFRISGCGRFVVHWKYRNSILEINSDFCLHLLGFPLHVVPQYLQSHQAQFLWQQKVLQNITLEITVSLQWPAQRKSRDGSVRNILNISPFTYLYYISLTC